MFFYRGQTYPGPVGELPGLVKDLCGQLPGGGQHQGQGVLLTPSVPKVVAGWAHWSILENPAKKNMLKKNMSGIETRAVDPHAVFAHQDPAVFLNADPDLAVFYMRMRN